MKKKYILLSLALIICTLKPVQAQIELGKEGTFANKWHEGKLVLKNNDTLRGLVKFDDVSDDFTGFSLSNKIKFKVDEDAKKQKFKKKIVDYFEVVNNSGEKVKFTYIKVKVKGLILVKIEAEGKANLYTEDFNYWSENPTMYNSGTLVYVKKKNEKKVNDLFLANAFKSFKKEAKKYFGDDCPELVDKLENGTYKSKDYKAIVKDYNHCQ